MGSHLENQDQLDGVGVQVAGAVFALGLLFAVLLLMGLGKVATEMERQDAPGGGEESVVQDWTEEKERDGMERREVGQEAEPQETERQEAGTEAFTLLHLFCIGVPVAIGCIYVWCGLQEAAALVRLAVIEERERD